MNQQKRILKKGEQYPTKIRSWSIGKNPKNGNLCVKVNMDGYVQWTGWLTEKAKPFTIEALAVMGFRGSHLGMLKEKNALDTEKEYFAIIGESRQYEGKTYYEADFVNDPEKSMGGWNDKDVTRDMVSELDSIDCRGYIDGATDISSPAASQPEYKTSSTHTDFASDDIPF